MLKIGEFARICQVSTQTLRYYDSAGILRADRIDPQSGYRYYNREKLEEFQEIQTLNHAGFSLNEIKLLHTGSKKARSELLARKRNEFEQKKASMEKSLALLAQLETELAEEGDPGNGERL